jgi:hypothetical protein
MSVTSSLHVYVTKEVSRATYLFCFVMPKDSLPCCALSESVGKVGKVPDPSLDEEISIGKVAISIKRFPTFPKTLSYQGF